MNYDIRPCTIAEVSLLCAAHHGYGDCGRSATYSFGVYEGDRIVAAYMWQPPPVGAAKSVCPEAPSGVLSLSRMVAVPKEDRHLNHVSRPLRHQMKRLVDRTRWPVLITFSDEGQGHTGHVYKCSGWQPTTRTKRPVFVDSAGVRRSTFSNGSHSREGLVAAGHTFVQRWEHWACQRGLAAEHMANAGWRRVPVPGRVWKSGAQAFTWMRE